MVYAALAEAMGDVCDQTTEYVWGLGLLAFLYYTVHPGFMAAVERNSYLFWNESYENCCDISWMCQTDAAYENPASTSKTFFSNLKTPSLTCISKR